MTLKFLTLGTESTLRGRESVTVEIDNISFDLKYLFYLSLILYICAFLILDIRSIDFYV